MEKEGPWGLGGQREQLCRVEGGRAQAEDPSCPSKNAGTARATEKWTGLYLTVMSGPSLLATK